MAVQTNANIEALGFGAISTFRTLLAAASADDVQPMAVNQLADLGSMLNVSGPLAAKVPDVLRRSSSHKIESLQLTIGWRKGDTSYHLSQTAGGQAAALLCVCLVNLVEVEIAGSILYRLRSSLLPKKWKCCQH